MRGDIILSSRLFLGVVERIFLSPINKKNIHPPTPKI
jgi:hypothetical protein